MHKAKYYYQMRVVNAFMSFLSFVYYYFLLYAYAAGDTFWFVYNKVAAL